MSSSGRTCIPSFSATQVRHQIKDHIDQGSFPIFGYPLIDFNDDSITHHDYRLGGWHLLSKPILAKGTKSETNKGMRILEDMISTYRLKHLEEAVLQEDFTKGFPLSSR